jgi:D-alanyl-D-alanine carboxypeptidase
MLRLTSGVSRGTRLTIFGLVAGLAVLAVATDPADARARRRSANKGGGYNPPYAAIVVDANSGAVLHASEADSLRHPASLTKIMTLYLLFERLEAGKIKLDTQMRVSAHAAAQDPTKLGLKPGQTLAVEDAIRGLVTKSANDAAVVIAEALAGDEEEFAKLMTRKARSLGMARTTYMNASGLPDRDQVTTARDQATLGRAIQERFPRHYKYFSTASFTYRGEAMRNHNHLLGRVEGVDGIKTGYTRASGFNLVTSVHRNNRHIVAVVLGGSSAGARDARMRSLIDKYIVVAANKRTAPAIAEAQPRTLLASAGDVPFSPTVTGSAPAKLAAGPAAKDADAPVAARPLPGSSEPIKPIQVKTIKVKLGPMHTASLAPPLPVVPATPAREERGQSQPAAAPALKPAIQAQPAAKPLPPAAAESQPLVVAALSAAAERKTAEAIPAAAAQPIPAKAEVPAVAAAQPIPAKAEVPSPQPLPAKAEIAAAQPIAANVEAPRKITHTGWVIQVGAFEAEREAKERLSAVQSKAKQLLGRADPFTETVVKGDKTFYRARFAGLQKDEAEAVCKQLKRNDIACMTIKN